MKKCLLSLMVVLPCVGFASDVPVIAPLPVMFDKTTDLPDPSAIKPTQDKVATVGNLVPVVQASDGNDEDELIATEELIANAMAQENWVKLQHLLDGYQAMPDFDGVLVDYAKGAMFRKQGKQKQAIASYQKIVATKPSLSYVKLDLALMLFEDRQMMEAKKVFDELEQDPQTPDAVLAVVKDFKDTLKKQTRFKPNIALNYEATDNVNHASPETKIVWLGKEWQKSDDSLPKSAHGIRYGVGLDKTYPVAGNHSVVAQSDVSGVYYWDNKDYNEQSMRLSVGYAYADVGKQGQITPFVEQNWLGKDKYNKNMGISASYGQALTPKTRIQLGANVAHKSYDDDRLAKRYDGNALSLSSTLSHGLGNGVFLYGGLDGTLDRTKDKELASVRYGVRGGVMQEFGGFGVNASVRYGKRTFDAPSTLVYNFVRKDNEYQASLALWHKKVAWRGLRPQANLRYVKIDSNMPAFYSRDGLSYFVSVEKVF